jgi:cystathionine beta-lyase/cystathionine gamma-synthase
VQAGLRGAGESLGTVISSTAAFEAASAEESARRARTPRVADFYGRYGNPTVQAFADSVADLEGAEAGVAFGSGMGAISSVVLALCSQGSHVVAQRQLFTASSLLFQYHCARFGIEVTLVDGADTDELLGAVRPTTQLVFVETPSNPGMVLVDLDAVGSLGAPITVVDSTFATPLVQRPLDHGVDLVVHSATKGLSGHNDATLGVVVGERELVDHIWRYGVVHGATASPWDAANGLRGLRTLAVRLAHQQASAMEVACRLLSHPNVSAVHYPGLESHPQRELAKRQMDGGGTCLSFEVRGGLDGASAFCDAIELCRLAPSLGGPETLVNHAATMTHAALPPDERLAQGITDGLIRLSLGLEHVDDVWADLDAALST